MKMKYRVRLENQSINMWSYVLGWYLSVRGEGGLQYFISYLMNLNVVLKKY